LIRECSRAPGKGLAAGIAGTGRRLLDSQAAARNQAVQRDPTPADDIDPPLAISTDKVCFVIVKAREFDAKVEVDDPSSGSNPTDDGSVDVLEDLPDDPAQAELQSFIRALNEDEQVALVALAWLGRGDYAIEEWPQAVAEARRAHNRRTAEYLLGIPILGDYLEQGLSAHGRSCEEFESGRL
jgi:hypothetical protein